MADEKSLSQTMMVSADKVIEQMPAATSTDDDYKLGQLNMLKLIAVGLGSIADILEQIEMNTRPR